MFCVYERLYSFFSHLIFNSAKLTLSLYSYVQYLLLCSIIACKLNNFICIYACRSGMLVNLVQMILNNLCMRWMFCLDTKMMWIMCNLGQFTWNFGLYLNNGNLGGRIQKSESFHRRKGLCSLFHLILIVGNVWCKLKAELNRNIKMNGDVLRLESYLMSLMFMYYTKHSDSLVILFVVHVSINKTLLHLEIYVSFIFY